MASYDTLSPCMPHPGSGGSRPWTGGQPAVDIAVFGLIVGLLVVAAVVRARQVQA